MLYKDLIGTRDDYERITFQINFLDLEDEINGSFDNREKIDILLLEFKELFGYEFQLKK